MKYLIVDEHKNETFVKEFETKEEAIKEADWEWNHLNENDKKSRQAYYILESVNPDPDAENHFDGDPIKEYK